MRNVARSESLPSSRDPRASRQASTSPRVSRTPTTRPAAAPANTGPDMQ
ncbi:Uncharacterised protein [Mycobacteroides abscessus]|nr:Uncharacterised protein [Mycobacteroides abscessus]